jgi:hypothetical protein
MSTAWSIGARGISYRWLETGTLQLGRGPVGPQGDWYEDLRGRWIDDGKARLSMGVLNVVHGNEGEIMAALGIPSSGGARAQESTGAGAGTMNKTIETIASEIRHNPRRLKALINRVKRTPLAELINLDDPEMVEGLIMAHAKNLYAKLHMGGKRKHSPATPKASKPVKRASATSLARHKARMRRLRAWM